MPKTREYLIGAIRADRSELARILKQESDLMGCYEKNKNSVSRLGEKQLRNHFRTEIKKIRFKKRRLVKSIEINAGELDGLQDR